MAEKDTQQQAAQATDIPEVSEIPVTQATAPAPAPTTEPGKKATDQEFIEIDLANMELAEGAEQEYDLSEDAWETAAPPPDGDYKVKLFRNKKFVEQAKTDDGDVFYRANLVCKITSDEDWSKVSVFAKVSTYIPDGKNISTAVGLLLKLGVKVPDKSTPLAIMRLLENTLKSEPQLWVNGQWKAWDMPKMEWIKVGMRNFPETNIKGKFHHVVRDSKGNTVNGKFSVEKWFGLTEYQEMVAKGRKQTGTGGIVTRQAGAGSRGGSEPKDSELILDN